MGDFVFLDFAGSGIVHLCGKLILIYISPLTITYVYSYVHMQGGMAALILQIFHKIEKRLLIEVGTLVVNV